MANYVEPDVLKKSGEAPESEDDNSTFWQTLAAATSRLFDRIADVPDDFFAKAGNEATEKIFRTNGTEYVRLAPYIVNSITSVKSSVFSSDESIADTEYFERDGYLIFNNSFYRWRYYLPDSPIKVTAKWGFPEIPPDIAQAVIEQALFMWRRKDLAFTDLSGVSTAAVQQQLSPTFELVAKKYRDIYGQTSFFA